MTITTAELASMRAASDAMLPGTCTISRPTASRTASGAPKNTYSDLATGVACRMDEPIQTTGEGEVLDRVGVIARWVMHFKYNQDITVKDRVVFGSNTYEVIEVLDSSSWLISRRAQVVRIE